LLRSIEKSTMAHSFALRSLAFLLLGIALAACSGAPVQEMSNARQAIRAAREAGAERTAPQTLKEAEALLNSAEGNLQRRAYRDARRDAIQAHDKAAEALDAARPRRNTG
jgi:hypothetical protein